MREADTAVRIGPAAAAESYLRADRLLEAAARTGAPGRPPRLRLPRRERGVRAGLRGRGARLHRAARVAIALMGDKIRAKETVRAAGVPVVPGSSGSGLTDDELAAAAREIGMPVLLKPSAGGGGKGMRLTRAESALAEEIAAARREARASFGDDTLLVERWIDRPRHIEIQVLADAHGNVVHLGERECSLQRRHQKIIEEAPSVLLDEATRAAMGEAAVQAARSCGYRGAGTVEFIVPGNDPSSYYFMEMNTRLQVEHPVTELITGLDLVEWQLRVAAGEELPFTQKDIALTGHAVEARICAEDPSRGFLPSGGTVLALHEPQGDGARTDSGLTQGTEVGSLYDPMLSKVIAYAPDRATALRRLRAALADTVVLGVPTNAGFLRRLLAHPDVVSGDLDTGLVERDADSLVPDGIPPEVYAAAALLRSAEPAVAGSTPRWTDPFSARTGWRLGGSPAWTVHHARVPGHDPVEIRLRATATGQEVLIPEARPPAPDLATAVPLEPVAPTGAQPPPTASGDLPPVAAEPHTPQPGRGGAAEERLPVRARIVDADAGTVTVELAGVTHTFRHATGPEGTWLGRDGDSWHVQHHDPVEASLTGGARSDVDTLAAPMPGTVTVVKVAVGDHVDAGQSLLVVEAMKMEHVISAPHAGTVTELDVTPGSTVAMDQVLAVVTPQEES